MPRTKDEAQIPSYGATDGFGLFLIESFEVTPNAYFSVLIIYI